MKCCAARSTARPTQPCTVRRPGPARVHATAPKKNAPPKPMAAVARPTTTSVDMFGNCGLIATVSRYHAHSYAEQSSPMVNTIPGALVRKTKHTERCTIVLPPASSRWSLGRRSSPPCGKCPATTGAPTARRLVRVHLPGGCLPRPGCERPPSQGLTACPRRVQGRAGRRSTSACWCATSAAACTAALGGSCRRWSTWPAMRGTRPSSPSFRASATTLPTGCGRPGPPPGPSRRTRSCS